MAPTPGIVASAVILPESQSQPNASKRRRSSVLDSNSKRPKKFDGSAGSPTTLGDFPQPTSNSKKSSADDRRGSIEDRRKTNMQEEKKRGQRLFGGLLSTLSQSTPTGQQKRRQEVEKRQQERAKQQKADDETRRKEKLASLKTVREAEQIKFNEVAMRTGHKNMLVMANFLSTKALPKVFYKPWEMTPAQEDRVKQQKLDAEATVEREITAFYTRYPSARRPSYPEVKVKSEEETNIKVEETMGEPQVEANPGSLPDSNVNVTNSPAQAKLSESGLKVKTEDSTALTEQEVTDEHNGEVVLENEEDTVIY